MTTDIDRMVFELRVIAKGQGIKAAEFHLQDLRIHNAITTAEWCAVGAAFNENRV